MAIDDTEQIIKHGCGICLFCGKDLQNNALEIPNAMKILSLSLESYNTQITTYTGPEIWACLKCAKKIAINSVDHAERFNDSA